MTSGKAKQEYTHKITCHFKESSDTQNLWQGIQTITDHKPAPQTCYNKISAQQPKQLLCTKQHTSTEDTPLPEVRLCLSAASTKRTLSTINTHNPADPDIPGRVLKDCTEELKDVFTDVFNISLKQTVVPPYFKVTIKTVPVKPTPSFRSLHVRFTILADSFIHQGVRKQNSFPSLPHRN